MRHTRGRLTRCALAALFASLLAFAPSPSQAQAYPSRPVHVIVGFTAGNNIDIVARLIGQFLSERLGQPFIIENRPVPAAISPPRRSCARLRTATRCS